jgi:hypothetical protein
MRSLLVAVYLLATAALSTQAFAANLSIPGATVSFDAPQGFTKLAPQEMAVKYPTADPPSFAVGNAGRVTTIAFDLKPHRPGNTGR